MEPLTGQQTEELATALCDAFDQDSLERMVQFKLGKSLWALVGRNGMEQVTFDLITRARQEGWTEALIRATYVARPNNPRVVAFCQTHFPRFMVPQDTADKMRAVVTGLDALNQILRRLADQSARQTVGAFQADIRATREKVRTLQIYKALHDHLHVLRVQYYRQIADEAAVFLRHDALTRILESYALGMKAEAARARETATGLRNPGPEEDWITAVEEAAAQVEQAIERKDDALLQRSVASLRRVLAEDPIRVNALLTDTAGDLRLEQLAEAMARIRERLGPDAARDGGLPLQEFEQGLAGLRALQPRLAGLVQEHHEWQWLDREFTAADALPGHTPQERFPRWAALTRRLLRLCGLSETKEWAQSLKGLIGELDRAGAEGNRAAFGRQYNKFRTVAADRFFNVDAELLALSEQLAALVAPLNQLLRRIADEHR